MLVELRINCHSSCCSVLNCVHLAGSLIPVLDPLSPFAFQDSASALALLQNRANRCAISQRILLPMVMLSTRIVGFTPIVAELLLWPGRSSTLKLLRARRCIKFKFRSIIDSYEISRSVMWTDFIIETGLKLSISSG